MVRTLHNYYTQKIIYMPNNLTVSSWCSNQTYMNSKVHRIWFHIGSRHKGIFPMDLIQYDDGFQYYHLFSFHHNIFSFDYCLARISNNLKTLVFSFLLNLTVIQSPFPAGCAGSLLDTFRVCHPKRKKCIFAVGFFVLSRYKHHNICDLRCFAAGNIANSLLNTIAMPLRCTFISNSANGLMHSLAEFYSMKLFFPNQKRSGLVLDLLFGFIEVL